MHPQCLVNLDSGAFAMISMEKDDIVIAAHDLLVRRRVIEPLARSKTDARLWLAWELAAVIEGHFHRIVDVAALDVTERRAWERRVTASAHRLRSPLKDEFRRAYWLLHNDERVGTLALDSFWLGPSMRVSSLYVRPDRRRCGIATRALDAADAAAKGAGIQGIRLETSWCWQPAIRFYLARRFWGSSWKHSIAFVRSIRLPDYQVAFDGSHARFSVSFPEGDTALLEAEHHGNALGWTELPADASLSETHPELAHHATTTLSLHLAVRGWPLIRSNEHWKRRWNWSDLGMPEGLACKIALFEHEAAENGYDVRTPRIPDLDYRADLEDESNDDPAFLMTQ
jgi:GNAT superfamily N-acetyltransferase